MVPVMEKVVRYGVSGFPSRKTPDSGAGELPSYLYSGFG